MILDDKDLLAKEGILSVYKYPNNLGGYWFYIEEKQFPISEGELEVLSKAGENFSKILEKINNAIPIYLKKKKIDFSKAKKVIDLSYNLEKNFQE